ncbi:MAG: glycosyltransferase [Oscillospiraceae bacterium]|nr:glycosyltransferase [Oscillospiraceae bacterium]
MFHILEVNKFYPPHIGGIETVVAQRAKYLRQFPDTQVKVLVCQEKGRGKTEIINGVEIIRCASAGTYFSCPLSLSFFTKFQELSKWADVIEFHMPFPLGDAACLLSHCQCRVVISWHSDVIRQKKLLKLYQPVLKKFLRRADCIITATQGHIDSSSFLPEFHEKCRVIPYPVEISQKQKYSPILTNQLLHPESVKLLFVGRLVYYKGVDVLIKALRKVRNCELFLCGTGVLEPELRKLAQNLPVHFLGNLSDADLKSAFADCDIFILPSVENSEAFGIVQQEAMTAGKPVINTSLPTGVPYVSIHQLTGLTVPPHQVQPLADAIQKLADSPALRQTYGQNARKRVLDLYQCDKIMQDVYHALKND